MKKFYSDGFFCVSPEFGFLPIKQSLKQLPDTYYNLQYIVDNLNNIVNNNLSFDPYLDQLPNYIEQVSEETDPYMLHALYRAYAYVSATYLLQPTHQEFVETGDFGKALNLLPEKLAVPFVEVSDKMQVYPWLEYNYAYSSGNYYTKDGTDNLHWSNLDAMCSFTGSKDEIGFMMMHVYIIELGKDLISSMYKVLENNKFDEIENLYLTLQDMNIRRREMWQASNHENYNQFRAFIMGSKGNEKIFGDGVVYEGVSDEPRQYRGETGAQDSVIPTCDIFSGVIKYYPENKLTEYLMDLRSYRPICMQDFLNDLNEECSYTIVDRLKDNNDYKNSVYLLAFVNEIYLFRSGHWQFVQKYILANTKYHVASGGTPITTWLPNQIGACLKFEEDIIRYIDGNYTSELFTKLRNELPKKIKVLKDQIEELSKDNYNIDLVYDFNDFLEDRNYVVEG